MFRNIVCVVRCCVQFFFMCWYAVCLVSFVCITSSWVGCNIVVFERFCVLWFYVVLCSIVWYYIVLLLASHMYCLLDLSFLCKVCVCLIVCMCCVCKLCECVFRSITLCLYSVFLEFGLCYDKRSASVCIVCLLVCLTKLFKITWFTFSMIIWFGLWRTLCLTSNIAYVIVPSWQFTVCSCL